MPPWQQVTRTLDEEGPSFLDKESWVAFLGRSNFEFQAPELRRLGLGTL